MFIEPMVQVKLNHGFVVGVEVRSYPIVVDKEEAALAARMGARIRERRDALGWSQAQLAEQIDTSVEYVSMLERGVRLPSLPTLVALGEALALSLDALVAVRASAAHEPDVLEAAARGVPATLRPLIARMLVAVADAEDVAPRATGRAARRR